MATGSIDTGTDQLLCEVREQVAVITLNRPESRNALGNIITPALRRMIRERGEDPDVGALLITGAGTAFCAGGDVKGMANSGPAVEMTLDQKVARLKERQRTLTGALVAVRKPTVAALPGPAAGAGLAIALACDIRIAATSAFISTGYARVGLSGDYGIAWLLTRLVGTAKARELLFTADRVDFYPQHIGADLDAPGGGGGIRSIDLGSDRLITVSLGGRDAVLGFRLRRRQIRTVCG